MNFVVGVLVGAAAASTLKSFFRPIARSAIKSSILLGMKIQELQEEVLEDLQDLKAEAKSELDKRAPSSLEGRE